MVKRVGPEDLDIVLKFGGGLHTRAPEDEINEREAADGFNFLIDVENSDLRPRPPFDLVASGLNSGASIRGAGSFRLPNGSVNAFIQAGDVVYEWDGASVIDSPALDTVNASARLRGHWRSHAWELDGKLLISDLALLEPVKEWDGTTWADVAFRSTPSTSFPTAFHAKYIDITAERVLYANIKEGANTLPHMVVGSKRSDYEEISVSDRPSSALGEADPFFLLSPDLRSINGLVQAFSHGIISTEHGRMFQLMGESSKDFSFNEFYPGSGASGDESLAYIGNDIIYGRPGRIESLTDTDRYGDTAADDLTKGIANLVSDHTGWTTVYNSRLNRVYLFPASVSECYVFDTAMRGGELSPWMRWTTNHSMSFQPTLAMSMLDPGDGLEYVFLGDSQGNFYRLEGTGANGDGGTTEIATRFTSRLFSLPLEAKIFNVQGYIKYRRRSQVDISIELLYSGESVFTENIIVRIPQTATGPFYSGDAYYSDGNYYGTASLNSLVRQRFDIDGGDANEFQVRVSVESDNSFDINEIGLRFVAAG